MRYIIIILFILSISFNSFADWNECSTAINKYTDNIPKFGGDIYYISQSTGNDSYDGTTPDKPFATISAGITAMSSGDALVIRAGTYTENVVLDCNSCELWFEIGAIIAPTLGTPFTVSGNYCRVICRDGALLVDPNGANTTGVFSGNFCYFAEIRVSCFKTDEANSGDIGFDITGDGCDLRRCRCSSPDIVAFKIQGDKIKLEDCCTGGGSGGTIFSSIGFWLTNNSDKTRIKDCGSQGHGTAGFKIDSGCTNSMVCGADSGGGDGRFVNNATTTNCIYSDLHYQGADGEYNSPIVKAITLTATGGVDGNGLHYRIFKLTGAIRMFDIGGTVTTVLSATDADPNIELTSTNATIELTDTDGVANISSAVAGSTLIRIDISTEALDFSNPDSTPAVGENTSKFTDRNVVELIEDDSADTYITLRFVTAPTSGAMLWACRYVPLTADGFLEPA